jgi:hypothetical protein
MEDLKLVGLGDFVSLITKIEWSFWGNQLVFKCLYDPIDRKPYKIIFFDCHEINWSIHSPERAEDTEADLIDIQLGSANYLNPAIIFTDIFEVSILYRDLSFEKE